LNNKVAAIQGVVESADTVPTEQSGEVFQMLSGKVDEHLNALDNAVKTELPRVNQMLQRQKLAPIKAEPLDPKKEEGKKKPDGGHF
jgi:hypothetical protein